MYVSVEFLETAYSKTLSQGRIRDIRHRRYDFLLSRLSSGHTIWWRPATGFSQTFPGIRPHLLTLTSNFKLPIYRDILLALGICSVSKRSCSNILSSGPGSAITIVVGGAAESLSAHPGTADLTLKRRCVILRSPFFPNGGSSFPFFTNKQTRLHQNCYPTWVPFLFAFLTQGTR